MMLSSESKHTQNKPAQCNTALPLARLPLAVAVALTCGGAGMAHANVLEETIVTAQKREQNLQDVGVSVTAFSGDQMKALGVTSTVEITEQVPGLQVNTFSPTLTIFNVRGVSQNNFTDNLEAPVAVYIDDAYVASMNMISGQLFDIDRVEVLRGPQGTLFGRNATGGLIHYLTRGADDDELNGYVEATVADYGKNSLEFAVGGGLSDRIRGRFAARKEKSDGYIEATDLPDSPPSSGVDLGGSDGYALRGALQFDFTDSATLDLRYKYSKDDEVPTGGYIFLPYADQNAGFIPPEFQAFAQENILGAGNPPPPGFASLEEFTAEVFFNPVDGFAPVDQAGLTIFEGDSPEPFKHFSDYEGFMDRETSNFTAKIEWELENGMQLVSITNYADMDKFYTEDGDGLPIQIIEFTTVADFEQLSQELRLSGNTDAMRWQVGAYYLDMETDSTVITRGSPIAGEAEALGLSDQVISPAVVQDYTLESSNWSVFGQVEYDLSDAFTLIAGYRWSQDDKELKFKTDFVDEAAGLFVPNLLNLQQQIAAAGGGDQDTVDYGDYAARLQLDWRVSDTTLAFMSYNRGIKGGNFAPSASQTLNGIKHGEEVLSNYEIGVKTELADGKVRLNATLFYFDYEDYQAFTFVGGTPDVKNADAENQGAEIELFLLPSENWDMILGVSYMDSSVDGVLTPQEQVTPVGFSVDWPIDVLDNRELPNAPTFSVNYLLRYNVDIPIGNIALQLDGAYYDDQYLEVTNGGGALQEAYNVSNVSATWASADESWRVSAWVKNVADEEYKLYNLDLGILGSTSYYAPPRWVGVTASYSF